MSDDFMLNTSAEFGVGFAEKGGISSKTFRKLTEGQSLSALCGGRVAVKITSNSTHLLDIIP